MICLLLSDVSVKRARRRQSFGGGQYSRLVIGDTRDGTWLRVGGLRRTRGGRTAGGGKGDGGGAACPEFAPARPEEHTQQEQDPERRARARQQGVCALRQAAQQI